MRNHRQVAAALVVFASICGCDEGTTTVLPDARVIDALDVPAGRCGMNGIGVVYGTVAGTAIRPVMRATLFHTAMWTIVLDEVRHPACGDPPATGEQLILLFCRKPTPGTYTIDPDADCPGGAPRALLMRDGAVFEQADSGTVTISSIGDCVIGTFAATFSNERLNGSFDAVVCPAD